MRVLGAKEISTGGSGATPAETLYIRLYILAEKTVGQFNGGGRQFPSSGRGTLLTGKGFLPIEGNDSTGLAGGQEPPSVSSRGCCFSRVSTDIDASLTTSSTWNSGLRM